MVHLGPPPPPARLALADGDGLDRLRTRLWLWSMTAITVLITAWCVTLGALPAILALVVAKHILVALLVMGLDLEADRQAEAENRDLLAG